MNGRRAGALALVAALVLVSSLVALGVTNGSYQDRFTEISYSGSDGNLKWSGPWGEADDDGGVTTGNVQVVSSGNCNPGNCVLIDAGLLVLSHRGVQRQADLSGAQSATLSFDYRRQPRFGATGLMAAQVRANSASLWTILATYPLHEDDSAPRSAQFTITGHASSQTQIRFVVLPTSANAAVFIDNVTIDVVFSDPATTTTTTTTTLLPITTTSLTLPILTTTTTLSATTTTTSPSRTTTTTSAGTSATTSPSTAGASAGDADESAADESTLTPPVGEEEIARAGELGVVVGLEPSPSRNVLALGLNPQQDLLVDFRSVVELIASEGVEALVLGTVIGFFAILGIKDRNKDDDEEAEDEGSATQAT